LHRKKRSFAAARRAYHGIVANLNANQDWLSMTSTARRQSAKLSTDDERWQAVVERDPAADGLFFYSVRTTGVYCRNVCGSRVPLRKNVRFFTTRRAAEAAGFRPCKKCRPAEVGPLQRRAELVARACRTIEAADESPSLTALARAARLSPHHFHRLFQAATGVTPKGYAAACRTERVRRRLAEGAGVADAVYAAGFNSSGRFYASATAALGMKPAAVRSGGVGLTIRFAVGECSLGSVLVAATDRGVCAILLGDDPEALVHDLEARFPRAELRGGDRAFERLVAQVVGFVERPAIGLDLPLDVRGTAFQRRVWEALQTVPCGSTTSYAEIARRIGKPKAVRAVAGACAANALAVAIPCHRVVRTDGSLSGYRWGIERKNELLRRESETR
jgi:AraC family transcriptional regulator of adaptative response/methylated-DNA-[protein]-cysteine methyltransferase